MLDFLIAAMIVLIISGALWFIRKEKRRGVQCVGCPDSKTCSGNCAGCSGNCGCSGHYSNTEQIHD